MNADPLPRLRELCLTLPEVTEKVSHGSPSWFVRRMFVSYADHHHGDEHTAFWCAAPSGSQEALVGSNPVGYFRPPYVGVRGWVGVRLDVGLDWEEIEEVVTEAYCAVAPRALVARLDQPQ